jgi:MSHA pilin protein MshD
MKAHKAYTGGFTLIELVLMILVLAVTLPSILLASIQVTRHSADPLAQQQALVIAQSYLEEILAKPYPSALPCSAPPTQGRRAYQTACDYQNLNDVGAHDQNGNLIAGLSAYRVQVTVDTQTAQLGALASGTAVLRVDVQVSSNQMNTVLMSAYRSNY